MLIARRSYALWKIQQLPNAFNRIIYYLICVCVCLHARLLLGSAYSNLVVIPLLHHSYTNCSDNCEIRIQCAMRVWGPSHILQIACGQSVVFFIITYCCCYGGETNCTSQLIQFGDDDAYLQTMILSENHPLLKQKGKKCAKWWLLKFMDKEQVRMPVGHSNESLSIFLIIYEYNWKDVGATP